MLCSTFGFILQMTIKIKIISSSLQGSWLIHTISWQWQIACSSFHLFINYLFCVFEGAIASQTICAYLKQNMDVACLLQMLVRPQNIKSTSVIKWVVKMPVAQLDVLKCKWCAVIQTVENEN
jgi:hypothetical protein